MNIRFWEIGDTTALRPMVRDCLRVNLESGADPLDSDKNVGIFLNMGLSWAAVGDPTLTAIVDGNLVGYTLWGGVADNEIEWRDRVCFGMGTYVLPAYRRSRVAARLRSQALTIAKSRGYNRVVGTAFHEIGITSAVAAGFRRTGVQMEIQL